MSKENKSTDAEFDQRVNKLIKLVSKRSRREICQFVSKRTDWSVSDRQVDRYIKEAKVILKTETASFRRHAIENIFSNYMDIFHKSYEEQDWARCESILDKIVKLFGVEAPKKIDIKTEIIEIGIIDNDTGKKIIDFEG